MATTPTTIEGIVERITSLDEQTLRLMTQMQSITGIESPRRKRMESLGLITTVRQGRGPVRCVCSITDRGVEALAHIDRMRAAAAPASATAAAEVTPMRRSVTAEPDPQMEAAERLVEVRRDIERVAGLNQAAARRLRDALTQLRGLVDHALATGEIVALYETVGMVARAEQDEAVYQAQLVLLAQLERAHTHAITAARQGK